jgi:ParB family chromosome partitioning protein
MSTSDLDDSFGFKDPATRRNLVFAVVPLSRLDVITHQRKPSEPHVGRIVDSIERIGFLAPIVVVEATDSRRLLIIDGQHRYLAAKQLGLRRLPVVVVPRDLAHRMLALNVEKEPNIRERASVALSIYRELVETKPTTRETDALVADAVLHAHYVTLGLAYAESGRLAGSAYESMLRKCDGFIDSPLPACLEVREDRATKVVEAHRLVRSITEKLKELGTWHEFATAQIISYANPLKRARKQHTFDDTFAKLITKLTDLEANPQKLSRGG